MNNIIKLATSFVVATLFVLNTSVGMAASGLPMLSAPVSSGADYANRLTSGNGVNGSPALVAQALHRAGRIEQSSVQEAANYLRNTEVRPCPQGTRQLSSVLGGSLGQVSRAYRPDEACLWDRNTQQVVGSASCGNIDLERAPGAAAFVAERGERGPQGERGYDGRDGMHGAQGPQGPRGERGPPGYLPPPPQGGVYDGYSGKELVRDLGNDLIWGYVVDRVTGKLTQAWVRREEIRGQTQVRVAYWESRHAPTTVVNDNDVIVTGNCNALYGSTSNCPTTTTTTNNPTSGGKPPQVVVVQGPPGPQGPQGPAGPIGPGNFTPPPVYTPPAPPYTPPAEPIVGNGPGYTAPAPPIYNGPANPVGPGGGNGPGYTAPGGPIYNGPGEPVCGNPPC